MGCFPLGVATAAPAFPEARGYGKNATGGRSGVATVIHVTHTGDSGPGSLRAALEASGPRFVVFDVSGTVTLEQEIVITNGSVTVAGQTAPGDGIQLRRPSHVQGSVLRIAADNVIVRYLTLRKGTGPAGAGDCVSINRGSNIVLDHCSLVWANDALLDATGEGKNGGAIQNVTLQRSILAEPLSMHPTASLVTIRGSKSADVGRFTYFQNLFAHCGQRNPRVTGCQNVQVINNVIYNWGFSASEIQGRAWVDFLNNFYAPGPLTARRDETRDPLPPRKRVVVYEDPPKGSPESGEPSIYIEGNLTEGVLDRVSDDNWNLVRRRPPDGKPIPAEWRRRTTSQPLPESSLTATAAYESVTKDVGNNRRLQPDGTWVPRTDNVDRRILQDVTGRGGFASRDQMRDPKQMYPENPDGYPVYRSERRPWRDANKNGLPDAWEEALRSRGKVLIEGAAGDDDRDGYWNIEEFLNGTDPKTADGSRPSARG